MSQTKRWVITPSPPLEQVEELVRELNLAPTVVELAIRRGFSEKDALEEFLYPRLKDLSDPFKMPDMAEAVNRILAASDKGETVTIYGDYDVDGVSSITLLTHTLRAYGIEPNRFLPDRIGEGYGLSRQGIEKALSNAPDTTLLIAADCGTNSVAEAEFLREQNIDLIILDHHEANEAGAAKCLALVNPKLGNSHHYLCTGGVVFKVAHALLKSRPVAHFDLKEYLDLVALATIADIVPLEKENRIFARRGLQQMAHTIHPGLRALKDITSVSAPVRAQDVGFRLGPRINAAGRLDSAKTALELMLTKDDEEAAIIAEELDQWNKDRQNLEQKTREEAEALIAELPAKEREHAIIVAKRGWHPGVVGIVASRICRQFHRPAFVIAIDDDGIGKGSGRSIEGISLVEAIDHAREHLEAGGGHEMAAGISVREDALTEARKLICQNIAQQGDEETFIPKLHLDTEVKLADLTLDLLDSYELLRPFGASNREPVFYASNITLKHEPRVIKERHRKFTFLQDGATQTAIHFRSMEEELPPLPWDIAFTIEKNEFRGRTSLNMIVRAIRQHQPEG